MTSRDFCYWLQGLFELSNPQELDVRQTTAIKAHLAMVFAHEIDPAAEAKTGKKVLDDLHDPFDQMTGGFPDAIRC